MRPDRFVRGACGVAAAVLAWSCDGIRAAERTTGAVADSAVVTPEGAVPMARSDREFIERATMGALTEVELARLAQARASREEVKQLGARMVEDHARAALELKQLAQIKGVHVPAAPDARHAREIQRLGKLSGPQFDRQYMAHMLSDHRKGVLEFKRASTSARDSDVKAFAGKALLTLEEHLKLAQSVSDSVQPAR